MGTVPGMEGMLQKAGSLPWTRMVANSTTKKCLFADAIGWVFDPSSPLFQVTSVANNWVYRSHLTLWGPDLMASLPGRLPGLLLQYHLGDLPSILHIILRKPSPIHHNSLVYMSVSCAQLWIPCREGLAFIFCVPSSLEQRPAFESKKNNKSQHLLKTYNVRLLQGLTYLILIILGEIGLFSPSYRCGNWGREVRQQLFQGHTASRWGSSFQTGWL